MYNVNWLWRSTDWDTYILSFLQQGSLYYNEKPEFVSKCEKGNGIGGPGSSDKWISNRVTARQCIEAVRSKYPTANGATIQNSCKKCRCWAEFGMTGWNRTDFNKKHFWGCKFNDIGKHISVIMCIMAFPVVEFSRQGYKLRKVFG